MKTTIKIILLLLTLNCYSQYKDTEYKMNKLEQKLNEMGITEQEIDTIIYTKKHAHVYLDTNFEAKIQDFLIPMLITSSISALTFYSITTANPILFGVCAVAFIAHVPLTIRYLNKNVWNKYYKVKIKL